MNDTTCTGGCACGGQPTGAEAPQLNLNAGQGVTRRGVLAGSAAVVALALAACADAEETSSGSAGTTTPSDTPATDQDSEAASESASTDGAPTGEVLATTGEFPTGGGKVVTTASGVVVVTQPADGDFKAFNGRCPHQGCPVAEVLENEIRCTCHGSVFDAQTGDRLEGPAPVGLEPVAISIEGDQIVLA